MRKARPFTPPPATRCASRAATPSPKAMTRCARRRTARARRIAARCRRRSRLSWRRPTVSSAAALSCTRPARWPAPAPAPVSVRRHRPIRPARRRSKPVTSSTCRARSRWTRKALTSRPTPSSAAPASTPAPAPCRPISRLKPWFRAPPRNPCSTCRRKRLPRSRWKASQPIRPAWLTSSRSMLIR